jgi:hypothetical protein
VISSFWIFCNLEWEPCNKIFNQTTNLFRTCYATIFDPSSTVTTWFPSKLAHAHQGGG